MLHQTLTTREDNHRSAIWFAMYPQNSCPVPLVNLAKIFDYESLKQIIRINNNCKNNQENKMV